MRIRPLAACGLTLSLLAALPAQQQTTLNTTLPTFVGSPSTNNLPFGQPKIRYQQWYDGTQLRRGTQGPVRITSLTFFGGLPTGESLDILVTMAHGGPGLYGTFVNNLVKDVTVVHPRAALSYVGNTQTLTIPFTTDFVFDGSSSVVVDIRIYNNANNQPFQYSAASTIAKASNTFRQFFVGNADATSSAGVGSTGHYGLVTQFNYQTGGAYRYGLGCPGGRGITPEASTNAVPLPGLTTFTQLLEKAGSNYPAMFILGASPSTWNGAPLPLSLGFMGAPNCFLEASLDIYVPVMTVGSGPGAGSAKLLTPIPAVGSLAGLRAYTQWVVFDKRSGNGVLSTAAPLMQVIGS